MTVRKTITNDKFGGPMLTRVLHWDNDEMYSAYIHTGNTIQSDKDCVGDFKTPGSFCLKEPVGRILAWAEYLGIDPFTAEFKQKYPKTYAEFSGNIRPPEKVEEDQVNSPNHYKLGNGLQSIDIIEAVMEEPNFRGFLWGNVLKYMNRWPRKGGKQDLEKARWYLDRLIGRIESAEPHEDTAKEK